VLKVSSIVHFEIPVDDLKRAKKFYSQLFGWKLQDMQGMDYTMIDTYGTPGGMYKRMTSDQQIMDHFGVPSVDEYSAKVEKLGGKIIVPKKSRARLGLFCGLYG
jgi:hypothetical protein